MGGHLEELARQAGYVGLFFIVFAESGLFFGFFLPGDSLLLTCGLLASRELFDLQTLQVLLTLAAIGGDNVGYWFGLWSGPKLFARDDSRFFKRKHLLAAQAFYEKHGVKTVILARYMPIVRTFAPIVAGAARMPYGKRFFLWDMFGAALWINTMLLLGNWIGTAASHLAPETVDKYFLLLVLVVIFVSLLPTIVHVLKERRLGAASHSAGMADGDGSDEAAAS